MRNALPAELADWARERSNRPHGDWQSLRQEVRATFPALPEIAINGVTCGVLIETLLARVAPATPPVMRMDATERRFPHAIRKEALLSDFSEELAEYLDA